MIKFIATGKTFDYKEEFKACGWKYDAKSKTWSIEVENEDDVRVFSMTGTSGIIIKKVKK